MTDLREAKNRLAALAAELVCSTSERNLEKGRDGSWASPTIYVPRELLRALADEIEAQYPGAIAKIRAGGDSVTTPAIRARRRSAR